ncbi:MAG: GTPase Era [Bifidobacteriaceae bacterium]|nr:GTPase Era [Bifidobacteriaceae bacterium]
MNNDITVSEDFKSGFISLVGRPNVGKSTIINNIIGFDLLSVSNRPETTRKLTNCVYNYYENDKTTNGKTSNGQIVFVDTPGIHKPRSVLGKRLNKLANEAKSDVDVLIFVCPADQPLGPGDKKIINDVVRYKSKSKLFAVLNKCDKVSKKEVQNRLIELATYTIENSEKPDETAFLEIFPLFDTDIRKDTKGVDELLKTIYSYLPNGPQYYPIDFYESIVFSAKTPLDLDQIENLQEYIREAALEKLDDELPHSLAIKIEDIDYHKRTISAALYVERDSQKGIIIGKKGSMIKAIGVESRARIEDYLNTTDLNLELKVKVLKNWQTDTKFLQKLGF